MLDEPTIDLATVLSPFVRTLTKFSRSRHDNTARRAFLLANGLPTFPWFNQSDG